MRLRPDPQLGQTEHRIARNPRERENPTFIGVFECSEARIQSRFPKPGVAGSNPAEGADPRFPSYSLTFWTTRVRVEAGIAQFFAISSVRHKPTDTLPPDSGMSRAGEREEPW